MRRRVPQAVSLCLLAGLIVPGAQGFPVYAAETEAVTEADGETVSETAVDTELTDTSEDKTAGETAAASDEEAPAEETADTEEEGSVVGELIFAQCEDYINVRTMANTDSPVTAKIYNHDSATVIAVTEDQEWYIVASGNACGYVKADYFATGEEAEAIASEVAYNVARVYADELNIRAEASTESDVIDVATAGDEIEVVLYGDDWMKVALGNDVYGYISSDYVEYVTYYPVGETLEEEAERLGTEVVTAETEAQTETETQAETQAETAAEVYVEEDDSVYEETWVETEAVQTEAAQTETVAQTETEAVQTETAAQTEAAQTEATAQTETEAVQTETTAQTETETVQTETTAQIETEAVQTETAAQTETEAAQTETTAQTETEAATEASTESSSSASTGESIANYALQFVGNPYVYGGTSLTSGADCSGFVQSVFAHFGIYLSRTAAAQSTNGTTVSTSSLQAGDLLFYSSTGSGIDHVAIYIGGGRIVHAANSTRGICTDSAYYATPVCAVRCY